MEKKKVEDGKNINIKIWWIDNNDEEEIRID
jgi:hypothetical protein